MILAGWGAGIHRRVRVLAQLSEGKIMATLYTYAEMDPPPGAGPRNDDVAIDEEWRGPAPTRYVVREIEFKMVNGRLQFAYRNQCRAQPLAETGIVELSQAYCRPAARSGRPSPFPIPAALAPQTPLDLEVKGGGAPLVVFLRLSEPGNMTFSASRKAVTHKNADDAAHYGGLRHVGVDGTASADPVPECKLVYFIAAPPVGDYRHGFNFNVDLEQDPGVEGGRRMLPLTIDPDIRFPGGSST